MGSTKMSNILTLGTLEAEKCTKQKRQQHCGTPCKKARHICLAFSSIVPQWDLSPPLAYNMICSCTYPQHWHRIGSVIGSIPNTSIGYDLQSDLSPTLAQDLQLALCPTLAQDMICSGTSTSIKYCFFFNDIKRDPKKAKLVKSG